MKRALIIGASGGIGSAVATRLRQTGVDVDTLSRRDDGLDITDETSVQSLLADLKGPYDLIFIATGALEINGATPEKSLRSVSSQAMMDQFRLNAIGPAMVLKHVVRLLPKTQRSVLAALSARVGSIGDNNLGGWYSYRASKAALNQIVRTASIEIARSHPQAICVALHPGTVSTRFTENYQTRHSTVTPAEAAENLLSVVAALAPADSGCFRDWQGLPVPW